MSLLFSEPEEDTYVCLICKEEFQQKHLLKLHLIDHTDYSDYCNAFLPQSLQIDNYDDTELNNYCDVELSKSKISFSADEVDITGMNNTALGLNCKEVHICSVCGKEFRRKDHLKKHHLVHSGKRPFTCLICAKKFSRKDRLKEHCAVHLSVGWSCYFCGKMFPQRCILRKHEMIHRGIKPFTCELCDGRFSRKNDLLRHRTSHTGEKPHFCEICGKRFSQRRLVKRHILRHKEPAVKKVKQKKSQLQ